MSEQSIIIPIILDPHIKQVKYLNLLVRIFGYVPPNAVLTEIDIGIIDSSLNTLTEREAVVVKMRFFEKLSYQNTGAKLLNLSKTGKISSLGISRERVRQIEVKALRKLRHPSRSGVLKVIIERLREEEQ